MTVGVPARLAVPSPLVRPGVEGVQAPDLFSLLEQPSFNGLDIRSRRFPFLQMLRHLRDGDFGHYELAIRELYGEIDLKVGLLQGRRPQADSRKPGTTVVQATDLGNGVTGDQGEHRAGASRR